MPAGRDLTADDLPQLSYLDNVVSETLRLYPPGPIDLRKSISAFDFEGHHIPAGTSIIISPYVTHRLPELWPEPTRFDPSRWSHQRKPAPYEYLPFGGGTHRCIGSMFATTEVKTMLAHFVRERRVELLSTSDAAVGLATMRPKHGIPARVLS
ncbi:cytochrome P450 [Fodinicola feengrottensis]|uniref:cytochrome P450 n=1 Tax=Fodinicola feengrottensis TaxID=435914 RepID=UPI0013D20F6E|nr:cytochrome P450 [Fodinicola feengrottensis]